jgi:hypothetical protein
MRSKIKTKHYFILFSLALYLAKKYSVNPLYIKLLYIISSSILLYKIVALILSFKANYNNQKTLFRNIKLFVKANDERLYYSLNQSFNMYKYGLFVWSQKPYDQHTSFGAYKKNPNLAIYGGFLMLMVTGLVVLDISLRKYGYIILANIALGFSFFAILLFFAHIKGLKYRRISLMDDHLKIQYGILNDIDIHYADISKEKKDLKKDSLTSIGLMNEFEANNVTIYFKKPLNLVLKHGLKKQTEGIKFYVTEKEDFIKLLDTKLI